MPINKFYNYCNLIIRNYIENEDEDYNDEEFEIVELKWISKDDNHHRIIFETTLTCSKKIFVLTYNKELSQSILMEIYDIKDYKIIA